MKTVDTRTSPGFDLNHWIDVLAAQHAPWWGIAGFIVVVLFFWRGPAVVRSINDLWATNLKLKYKHRENMEKLRHSAQQKIEQQPRTPRRR